MRILILGGDGYLGWPTAMYLSKRHEVAVVDNFSKRRWEKETGAEPLLPVLSLADRVSLWRKISGRAISQFEADLCDYGETAGIISDFAPEAIVHYGEQPSAPFSMISQERAVMTQVNNITGTLNVLWALREHAPACHLVKLGTMGEYGTPNIDIEEGFIEIEHHGRRDVLPFPKQPGSFYHLSKVHDSHNILFACRIWKLRATDLNQGVVYGIETNDTAADPGLAASFHYDAIFGTALNRFCVQAVAGIPLTLYGRGSQKRGFLNIHDTLQCVELAILNPPDAGEFRVFNQFTEVFSVHELARLVKEQGAKLGLKVELQHLENPRVEAEEHYYNPRHQKLVDLGLKPHLLSDVLIDSMLVRIQENAGRIRRESILPGVEWRSHRARRSPLGEAESAASALAAPSKAAKG
ncbi:MAG: NAD-dependent epimerase/dehydratase family protein [Acidobacteriota bacterium]|nr:NAD-dependent epimerase/dehydratase family protein [Acidobacteriota bacterium]